MTKVLLVSPTYNEASNITLLIQSLTDTMIKNNYDYHILIVDDNSPDGTGGLVESLGKTNSRIHVLKRPGKMGLGSAYIDGFTYALSNLQFDVAVQIDADFSHPPEYIANLVEAITNGNDVAVGSRYVEGGGSSGWPLHRRLISRGANYLVRIMLSKSLKDATSGFKAMSRKSVESLLGYSLNSRGYSYQVESILVFDDLKLRIKAVPYTFKSRLSGDAKLSFKETLVFFWFVVKTSLSGVKKK